jgi:hypothetical protein
VESLTMPTISCTEFSRQLSEAVETRKSVDTVALREHASSCPECRCEWLDALLVDRAVAHWPKPVAVAGLTERILSQVAAETAAAGSATPFRTQVVPARQAADRPLSPAGRRINRSTGATIAALALCVCAMLFLLRSTPRSDVGPPEVTRNPPSIAVANGPTIKASSSVKPTSPVAVDAPVELMVADAGSAYLHLAGNAAKAVTAATVLVPPADAVGDAPPTPMRQEPWVDGVRREIAPVTHQLGHAFEFLIQAVPEKRAPAT